MFPTLKEDYYKAGKELYTFKVLNLAGRPHMLPTAHASALGRDDQARNVEGLLSDYSTSTPGLGYPGKSNEHVFFFRKKHLCSVVWKHTLHTTAASNVTTSAWPCCCWLRLRRSKEGGQAQGAPLPQLWYLAAVS